MFNKPINIIFIHRGKCNYLRSSLACARRSNPEANIFLIDDNGNCPFDSIKHYNINDYSDSAKEFAKKYQHFSSNPFDFELFCIQRWFILLDFVKINGLENFFYADSDVLIFSNLTSEWPKFSNFSFTLSEGSSGHNSFWNSPKILDDFCNFVMNIYSQKDKIGYKNIVDFWKNYQLSNKAGGVCDMTLFRFYKERCPGIVGETAIIINDSTYDDNFSSGIQNGVRYKMSIFGTKKIYWKSDEPYGKDNFGKLIKFNTLHFQGDKKRYIGRAYQRKNIYAWGSFVKGKVIIILKKIGLFKLFIKLKNI